MQDGADHEDLLDLLPLAGMWLHALLRDEDDDQTSTNAWESLWGR